MELTQKRPFEVLTSTLPHPKFELYAVLEGEIVLRLFGTNNEALRDLLYSIHNGTCDVKFFEVRPVPKPDLRG